MDSALFAKIAKVLADPQRFAILQRIAKDSECPCIKIVEEFPITQATISHHLKELAGAELVEVRREGKCAHFSLRRETLDAYQAELAARLGGLSVGSGKTSE